MKKIIKIVTFISVGLASSLLFSDAGSQAQLTQGVLDLATQASSSKDVLSGDNLQEYLTKLSSEIEKKLSDVAAKIKTLQKISIPGKDTIIATLNAVTQGLNTKLQSIKIDLKAPKLPDLQTLYEALSSQLADLYIERMNADINENPKERKLLTDSINKQINDLGAVMTLVKDKMNALQ